MALSNINFTLWNVNGMQNMMYRYKILMQLKSLGCNIAMIQEIHLKEAESRMKQRWMLQIFSNPALGKQEV